MLIYYAHCMSIYDTPQEQRDIQTLMDLGFEVLNPNGRLHDAGYAASGMEYFKGLVEQCYALAFRTFADGSIPAGVAQEIEHAKEIGIPVFELPTGVLRRTLNVEETREYLRECGQR